MARRRQLSENATRRTGETVRRVEATPRNRGQQRGLGSAGYPVPTMIGKADADIDAGSSGVFTLWRGPAGSEVVTDPAEQETAHDWLGKGCKEGAKAFLFRALWNGAFYFIADERPSGCVSSIEGVSFDDIPLLDDEETVTYGLVVVDDGEEGPGCLRRLPHQETCCDEE